MENKKLLQVKISEPNFNELMEFKKGAGISTLSDVIKFSIALLQWVVKKQKDGFDIYAIPNSKRKEGEDKGAAEKIDLLLPIR